METQDSPTSMQNTERTKMKNARLAMGVVALAAAGLLAGCTTARTDSTASLNDTTMSGSTTVGTSATATTTGSTAHADTNAHGHGHATAPATAHSSTTTAGTSSASMGHSAADMKTMCDMHDRVMKAKTDAERDAALDANVRAMPPAEKKQYVDMMHKHCM